MRLETPTQMITTHIISLSVGVYLSLFPELVRSYSDYLFRNIISLVNTPVNYFPSHCPNHSASMARLGNRSALEITSDPGDRAGILERQCVVLCHEIGHGQCGNGLRCEASSQIPVGMAS